MSQTEKKFEIKKFLSDRKDGNMALYAGEDRECVRKNRKIFFDRIGVDARQTVFLQQTHSDHIVVVQGKDVGRGSEDYASVFPDADAMVTDVVGIILCIQVADCVPILLFDPVRGVVGAIHSGWRGTLQNIVEKTVLSMRENFGSDAENIQVWIGPAIGGCCLLVDSRIVIPIRKNNFEGLTENGTHWDIKAACKGQLLHEGILAEHIEMSSECTVCGGDAFFSYKREGAQAGRMVAGIALAEEYKEFFEE